MRRILSRCLDVEPESLRFRYGPFGKPSLDLSSVARAEPIHFNLSHCEELFVLALSRFPEIGIDVEKARPISDEAQIAKRFFQIDEWNEYRDLPSELRHQGFLNAWTRKEAILKARGEGLQTPLDAFQVALDPRTPCRIRRFVNLDDSIVNWSLHAFNPTPSAIAAVAVRMPSISISTSAFPSALSEGRQIVSTTANPSEPCPRLPY